MNILRTLFQHFFFKKRLANTIFLSFCISWIFPALVNGLEIPSRTLTGHHGEIFALAFDPVNQTVASAGGDQSIRLWNAQTGRLQSILKGHSATIRTLAFSPKGQFLASGASDKTTRVWDIKTGKKVVSFSSMFGSVRTVAFSPNGNILASAGDGGSLRLLDWKAKKELKAMKSGFGIVYSVRFSPDGNVIATGNSDSLVHVWDPTSGHQLQTFSGHIKAIHAVAFSPDGSILASASLDGTVRLWDMATGRPRGILSGHTGEVHDVVFSPDGKTVISGGKDGTVRIWDWMSGRQRMSFSEHRGPVWTVALSQNGSLLASGGRDRVVRLMSPQSSVKVASKPEPSQVHTRDADVGPPPSPPPQAEADLSIHPHDVKPGEPLTLGLTIANTGKGPLYRFQGKTQSTDPLFDGHFFYFGKIQAGQSQTETVTIQIPHDHPIQEVPIQITFEEYNGFKPDPLKALVVLTGGPRPRFAYNYKVMDDGSGQSVGNGDGRIQKGEAVDILFTLKNVGSVPAKNTWVEMENISGQHLEIRPTMIRFGQMAPNQSKQARISFTVWPDFPKDQLTFHASIQEKTLQIFLNEKLSLALDPHAPQQIVATNKIIRVTQEEVAILSGAGSESSVIATVNKDQSLAVTGELGDWFRVSLSEEETGWMAKGQAEVVISTAKGNMPIPVIRGLEENRTSQFITLTDELKRAQSERAEIEQVLQQREQEMQELRAKLEPLSTSERAKLSTAQEQLEQERLEQEHIKSALRTREQEMETLRQQLASMTSTQTTTLTTMQEKLQQEQAQREQAEKALQQHQSELAHLRTQLSEVEKHAQTPKTPPAIALATPFDGQKVEVDRIQLVGAAASELGISRVEIRVNNELLARRQGRGVSVVPDGKSSQATLEFSEFIALREGPNDILVIAYDGEQISTTRKLKVTLQVDKGKIWAVVIGISQYDAVRPLKYADKDAIAFHDYLVKDVGIPTDQISLLLNKQATLIGLKRTLGTDLKRKANPQDTVIIYYAGHGAPETDASSPDGDGLEKYLIPYDADPHDLYTTGLPMREVETIFHRLSAERVIFITDSCYSGATAGRTFSTVGRRAVVSDNFLTRLSKGKGRVVLTASRAGEISEERDELGHGVFTYYLLEGLKGKADIDADQIITVDEAYAYVSKHVPTVTGQNQHPVKKGEFEGQLILGRVHNP